MGNKFKEDKSFLVNYIIAFKLDGHSTWRLQLLGSKDSFDDYVKKQGNFPPITGKKTFVFDRITGKIKEQ